MAKIAFIGQSYQYFTDPPKFHKLHFQGSSGRHEGSHGSPSSPLVRTLEDPQISENKSRVNRQGPDSDTLKTWMHMNVTAFLQTLSAFWR